MSKDLPKQTKVVVIGGGIAGCSVAYHLAKFGWKDTILLERDQLTSGTTWHAAGLVGQLGATSTITKLRKYSLNLYKELEAKWSNYNCQFKSKITRIIKTGNSCSIIQCKC
jgi:glycine/D-amino acid oxidase-like deaminating enzyme